MRRVIINEKNCNGCGRCVNICPLGSIALKNGVAKILSRCQLCKLCIPHCPKHAIEIEKNKATTTDLSLWKGILVFVQQNEDSVHPIIFELLAEAHKLAKRLEEPVFCVAVGHKQNLSALAGCGIERVYCYESPLYAHFRFDSFGEAVCDCIEKLKPSIVLFGATLEGRSLAPFAAVRFETGLTADCIVLEINEKCNLVQIRPAFGGNVMAKIVTEKARPQMASVRQMVMEPIKPLGSNMPEILNCSLPEHLKNSKISIIDKQHSPKKKDITNQSVLVAIGNGVKRKEDIPMFEELAHLLGGELASSRVLVEKGWLPVEKQIGLSGKTVRPKFLIICGVSGSLQFRAGISGAENIIAINKDPKASIFSFAHWSVKGDMYEIVPLLIEKLKNSPVIHENELVQRKIHQ